MIRGKGLCALLVIFLVETVRSDELYDLFHRPEPCDGICKNIPEPFISTDYGRKCCERGCRFFNLVDERHSLIANNVNDSKDACESSCNKAYDASQERSACTTGCYSMAQQRFTDLLSLLTVLRTEANSNMLLMMSLDVSDNDVMTDPGLQKDLLPGWWDSDGFKLSQTFVKTLPNDADNMDDYGSSSIIYAEPQPSSSIPGSDWLQCASRHTGIPRWLLASAIVIAASAAIWLCFIADRWVDTMEQVTGEKQNVSSKVTIVIPDEAPLYKNPPPKYSEVADINDVNLKR